MEEKYKKFLNFNKYLRDNLDKFILAFSMFYGEENGEEFKKKIEDSIIIIGYQDIDDISRIINNISKEYTNKFIMEEIKELNIEKEYYFSNYSFDLNNNMLIDKFKKYYDLEKIGIEGRKEKFIQEGYIYLKNVGIDITLDKYREYINNKSIPDEMLLNLKKFEINNIKYYIDISNFENEYNRFKKNFYDEIKLSYDVDFTKNDKFNEFVTVSECYKRALERYNDISIELNSYKEYVKKANILKDELLFKYKYEYFSRCKFLFTEEENIEIDKYLKKEITSCPKCLNVLSSYSLFSESLISSFSSDMQKKLDDENETKWVKLNIIKSRIDYFKVIGIDLGDDYNNYINNEDVKKVWPTNEIVKNVEDIRLDCINKFNIEYYSSLFEYKEFREEIDNKNLLNKDDSFDASTYIKKVSFINPNIIQKNNEYELSSIACIHNNIEQKYIDHIIVHELNHLYELCINNISNDKVSYLCGWDFISEDIKKEKSDVDTNKKYNDYKRRDYELFNEIINEMISQEISKLMIENDIFIFNDKDNVKYRGFSSYESTTFLIKEFYQEFREDIIESRKNGNINIIFDRVGRENFDELNNLFNMFNEHFSGMKYFKVCEDIRNNIDNDNTRLLNEIVNKKNEILNNMKSYRSNIISK